jgi:hypothetical protein
MLYSVCSTVWAVQCGQYEGGQYSTASTGQYGMAATAAAGGQAAGGTSAKLAAAPAAAAGSMTGFMGH